jgi:hypothetical protein
MCPVISQKGQTADHYQKLEAKKDKRAKAVRWRKGSRRDCRENALKLSFENRLYLDYIF